MDEPASPRVSGRAGAGELVADGDDAVPDVGDGPGALLLGFDPVGLEAAAFGAVETVSEAADGAL